jgi:uncharacterized membrane protein
MTTPSFVGPIKTTELIKRTDWPSALLILALVFMVLPFIAGIALALR